MSPTPQVIAKRRPTKSAPISELKFTVVHKALSALLTYPAIMAKFRELDGDQYRWNTADLVRMSQTLSYTEDALELERTAGNTEQRRVIAKLRRTLEDIVVDV